MGAGGGGGVAGPGPSQQPPAAAAVAGERALGTTLPLACCPASAASGATSSRSRWKAAPERRANQAKTRSTAGPQPRLCATTDRPLRTAARMRHRCVANTTPVRTGLGAQPEQPGPAQAGLHRVDHRRLTHRDRHGLGAVQGVQASQ